MDNVKHYMAVIAIINEIKCHVCSKRYHAYIE